MALAPLVCSILEMQRHPRIDCRSDLIPSEQLSVPSSARRRFRAGFTPKSCLFWPCSANLEEVANYRVRPIKPIENDKYNARQVKSVQKRLEFRNIGRRRIKFPKNAKIAEFRFKKKYTNRPVFKPMPCRAPYRVDPFRSEPFRLPCRFPFRGNRKTARP